MERSTAQLAEARRLAERDGEEGLVDFRLGEAMHLPLRDQEWGTFDVAHARFILEHVPDPVAVVRAMVHAVRPEVGSSWKTMATTPCGCGQSLPDSDGSGSITCAPTTAWEMTRSSVIAWSLFLCKPARFPGGTLGFSSALVRDSLSCLPRT